MIVENINNSGTRPRILVVPLDWGLGHATRCIPVIRSLMEHNDVVLAGEGAVVVLLQKEFPDIPILFLKGYRIKYSRHKSLFALKILIQFPGIIAAIRQERKWLKRIITSERIDAVISDNRFGLFNKNIPCIYITHQLHIQAGNNMFNKIAQRIHYHFINKFAACWVPDNKNGQTIAGILSHPLVLPKVPVDYLGVLSRCKRTVTVKKYDFLLLISGPEPQRSIFENILLKAFEKSPLSLAIVRGLPGNNIPLKISNSKVIIFDHLAADDLCRLIQECESVIARSGYSTIMDLVTLQQKAVLIPTPGQTEQEYLAGYLMEQKLFYTILQENISQENIEAAMHSWEPDFSNISAEMDKAVITQWLQTVFNAKLSINTGSST